ncbi:hypothetical protein H0H92_004975, partial [Tricholoma furcatifolium]
DQPFPVFYRSLQASTNRRWNTVPPSVAAPVPCTSPRLALTSLLAPVPIPSHAVSSSLSVPVPMPVDPPAPPLTPAPAGEGPLNSEEALPDELINEVRAG